MAKQNCWEFKQCGREPGGANAEEMGICPAATDALYDGLNEGKNAGRICWAVAGTFCDGNVQGTFAQKRVSCQSCSFLQSLKEDEGVSFIMFKPGQSWVDRIRKGNP